MEEPPYPGTIALVSVWLRMTMTQIRNQIYKYLLALTYPIYDWYDNFDIHGQGPW